MYKVIVTVIAGGLLLSACFNDSDERDKHVNDSPGLLTPEISILTKGAKLHGANGMAFDENDKLYIASVFGREIVVIDPETGDFLDHLGIDQGVEGPDDLDFGTDGSLYWTSIATGEVVKRDLDGTVSVIATLPIGVNPVTVSDSGRLFVGLCFYGDTLYEIDPDGVAEPRVISDNLGGGCGYNGFDWGPDGFLYAPGFFRDEIAKIDVDSGDTTIFAKGFGTPNAVKFDSLGQLYVNDTERGEIYKMDLSTGERELVLKTRENIDNIAFDSKDRLYISGADDGLVAEVKSDGTLRIVLEPGLTVPGGIAFLNDTLYVADNYSLVSIDTETGEQKDIVRSVNGISELAQPLTVSVYKDSLVLSSYLTNTVQIWDPGTNTAILTLNDFNVPMNAVVLDDELIVAELGTQSVIAVSIDNPSNRRDIASGISYPVGLLVKGQSLWVTNWVTGELLQLIDDGNTLQVPEVITNGLMSPEGLVMLSDDMVLVVESAVGRLTAVDLLTGKKQTVAEELAVGASGIVSPIVPPSWMFNGVTKTSDKIIVTGDKDNVIYEINVGEI